MKKHLFFYLLSLLSFFADAQFLTGTQLRLRNNTDSVSTAATTGGTIRYDPITGKYRFRNGLTNTWVSFGNGSGTIGGSTGSTDNAILRANGTGGATIQSSSALVDDNGSALFGHTSFTSNTRLETRGTDNASTSFAFRASSLSGTNLHYLTNNGLSFFFNAMGVGTTPTTTGVITAGLTKVSTSGNEYGIGYIGAFAPSSGTATFAAFNANLSVNQTGGANGVVTSFRNNLGFLAGSSHIGFDHNPTNPANITGSHLAFRATSGSMLIGHTTLQAPTTRLQIRSFGAGTGYNLLSENSSGTRIFSVQDNGALYTLGSISAGSYLEFTGANNAIYGTINSNNPMAIYGSPRLTGTSVLAGDLLVSGGFCSGTINGAGGNVILSGGLGEGGGKGDVIIDPKGDIRIISGVNESMGRATLVGGTVTVSNTKVTSTCNIYLTSQVDGGTPGFIRVSARSVGSSFTVTSSSATDTSIIGWLILEQN